MGKPFEVIYSPDNWTTPNGGVAQVWSAPYGGLHIMMPENMIGPSFSPALDNMMLRNGEMRSRPRIKALVMGPDDVAPILGVGSFLSFNQVLHTFCFTPNGLYQLNTAWQLEQAAGRNPWSKLGGPTLLNEPVQWQSYVGTLYYTNGLHTSAWDGKSSTPITDVAFAGAAATTYVYGAKFLTELDNHLLLAYTEETTSAGVTTKYANRVRWSNNGFNPTTVGGSFGGNLGTSGATFDATINVNAGLNDFFDVPDIITGVMTVGRTGYIFRQNGITEVAPTGNGIAPFDFNHLWASRHGIGNVYPYTIAQYGNMGIFASFEQFYQITPGGMQAIGGGARDIIIADLASAIGSPKASIDRGFNLGYTYLVYHLRIPVAGGMRSYLWSQEDGHWERWTHTGVYPTGNCEECWV